MPRVNIDGYRAITGRQSQATRRRTFRGVHATQVRGAHLARRRRRGKASAAASAGQCVGVLTFSRDYTRQASDESLVDGE